MSLLVHQTQGIFQDPAISLSPLPDARIKRMTNRAESKTKGRAKTRPILKCVRPEFLRPFPLTHLGEHIQNLPLERHAVKDFFRDSETEIISVESRNPALTDAARCPL